VFVTFVMFAELPLRFFPSGFLSGVNARAIVYTGMCSQYYCLASLLTLACVLGIVFLSYLYVFIGRFVGGRVLKSTEYGTPNRPGSILLA
jgi:hypothetical protein